MPVVTTQELELDLQIPDGFSLQKLFPRDRLLRLHPNWFVEDFKQGGISFTSKIREYVTEEEFSLAGRIVYDGSKQELLTVTLSAPIDIRVSFIKIKNILSVRVIAANGEINADDPILLWIRAIKEYIRIYLKRTPVTLFFRLLMNRMLLTMNPSQRKICLMIAKITAVELLVIVLIVVGYVAFVL
jgi:hypothetical protein